MSKRPIPNTEIVARLVDTPTTAQLRARKKMKRAQRFVLGPLPWPWLCSLALCHPRALELALTIKMLSDTAGREEVALSSTLIAELGLGRESKRRALAALETAGLVEVKRMSGRLPLVSLRRELLGR